MDKWIYLYMAPNVTAYKRWSCHSGYKLLCNCVESTRPQRWGPDLPLLGKLVMRTGWMAGAAPHKSGGCRDKSRSDNLTQTSLICDICHKQIHVRKQISIRCKRIEHWVHLRCAGIRQAQYTDTWKPDSHLTQT